MGKGVGRLREGVEVGAVFWLKCNSGGLSVSATAAKREGAGPGPAAGADYPVYRYWAVPVLCVGRDLSEGRRSSSSSSSGSSDSLSSGSL